MASSFCRVIRNYYMILSSIVFLGVLSKINYLLFHSIAEVNQIIIGIIIIMIAINTHQSDKEKSLTFLAISYGFTCLFIMFHIMYYPETGYWQVETPNLSIQFSLIARLMEASSLLLYIRLYQKDMNNKKIFIVFFLVSSLLLFISFNTSIFPVSYIEELGFTTFKKCSEIGICLILVIALFILHRNREQFPKDVAWFLWGTIVLTICANLSFVLNMNYRDHLSVVGHLLKVLSFYFIYKGVVQIHIIKPYKNLKYNENRYHNLVQAFPQAILIQSKEGISFANSAGLKILGYTHIEQVQGKFLGDFIQENEEWTNRELPPKGEEFIIEQEGGSKLEIMIISTPFNDDSKMYILNDISQQKRAERFKKQLELEEEKLKALIEYEQIKAQFYTNITHEFKTPLNVILGITQLLNMGKGSHCTNENCSKYLHTIKQNCYRLWRLMDNMIDISRLKAGSFDLSLSNNDIVHVVEEITLSIADYIKDSDLTITFDTDVEEKVISCDPELIERIVLNLVSNGIKFSKEGGKIDVNILDGEDYVQIEVKDNGIGIPREKIYTIFESFTKVDGSLTRNTEGSGMGLTVASSLVSMHHGKIQVHSEPEKGSKFVVKIPATTIANEERPSIERLNHREKISIEFSDIYSLSG